MVYVLVVLMGLVLGSFVNALVWRLRQQELLATTGKKGKSKARALQAKDLSILTGRSMCTDCHHELTALDLVPVLSWLVLGGKCRYCRCPISWQYPLVELITAGLFIGSYLSWPQILSGAAVFDICVWLVCIVLFMALAVYDLRWFLLPDKIVFPLISLAVAKTVVDAVLSGGGLRQAMWAGLAAVCIAGLFYVIYLVSRGIWIGFGDVKLAIALGLLVAGPLEALLVIFVAAILGSCIALPLLAGGRAGMRTQIPFGPLLLAATIVVVLFGARMLAWYTGLLLPS